MSGPESEKRGSVVRSNFGFYQISFGLIICLFFLLIDLFGIGKPGIQAAQLLGIQAGVWIALAGVGILISQGNDPDYLNGLWKKIFLRIGNLPTIVWIVLGFSIVYVFLFVFPIFFNPERRIHYFYRYIPDIAPIGNDLIFNTGRIRDWLVSGVGLYSSPGHYYPPLYAVVFAPLLLFSYPGNFFLMTAISLLFSFVSWLVIPFMINGKRAFTITVFFFLTAIFSYGMQFELERGQFNMVAFTLCLLAIYFIHFQNSYRHLAYVLFSVAVQIKIYPAIFIFMLVKDWRDWKNNLLRLLGLGLFNLGLLFILGLSTFTDFIRELVLHMGLDLTFPGNHSITSFVYNLSQSRFGLLPIDPGNWLTVSSKLIQIILAGSFVVCLLATLVKMLIRNQLGFNPDLFLVCTVGAMILPSVSVDYKLPLLAAPLILSMSQRTLQSQGILRGLVIVLIIVLSVAYSITLFPYIYRPAALANSFPLLFIILVSVTLLFFLDGDSDVAMSTTQ